MIIKQILNKSKSIIDPASLYKFIREEQLRKEFSEQKNLQKFIEVYKNPTLIQNRNSGAFWDERNFENDLSIKNNPMADDRLKTLVKLLIDDIKTNDNILNIGCGNAVLEKRISFIKTNIFNLVQWLGIDISNKSINYAKQIFKDIDFQCISINDFPTSRNMYDRIVASEVIEHIEAKNIFIILRKIHSLLKKGGKLYVSVPLNENLEKLILTGTNTNSHLRLYSESVIRYELEISGFKICRTQLLSAFHKNYKYKKLLNKIINLSEPNNIIIVATKI